MRYWVQFLDYSTGYVPGSIPPRFDGPKTLQDVCGSDGIYMLDGRNSEATMRRDALERAIRLQHWKQFAGFQIVQGESLTQEVRRTPVETLTYPIDMG